jgi:hypothetical protein
MVLPSAEYATPRGFENEAALPVPSAKPLPLPASVVTAPVATSISRTRLLFASATAMVLPSAEYARAAGLLKKAALPVPSAKDPNLPASVVTAPVVVHVPESWRRTITAFSFAGNGCCSGAAVVGVAPNDIHCKDAKSPGSAPTDGILARSWHGLDCLSTSRSTLTLKGFSSLKDVMGMPTVKAIVGGITSDLPSSFEGLHKVETLNRLRGLVGLVGIVQGAVEVSDNTFLAALTGLERVTTIGKNLQTMPVLSKAPNEDGSSSSSCFSRSVMDALALGTVPAPFLMSALGSFPSI